MKFIKICLILIVLIPVALVTVLVVAPDQLNLFISKNKIESYLKSKTGYNISFGESFKVKLLPHPYLSAENVNVKSFIDDKNIFHADKIELTASLRDLVYMNLSIKKLLVETPTVYLHRDIDNVANWRPKRIKRRGSNSVDLSAIKGLGDIVISNASFVYEDDLKGSRFTFVDGQFSVDGGKLSKTNIKLEGMLNEEKIESVINLDLSSVITSDISGDILLADNKLEFIGTMDEIFSQPSFEGNLKFNGPTIFETLYKVFSVAPSQRHVKFPLLFESEAIISSKKHIFSNLITTISVSPTNITFVSDLAYEHNKTDGNHLKLKVNVPTFLDMHSLSFCQESKNNSGKFEWSKELIDFTPLKQLNADITIETPSGFMCGNIKSDHASLRVIAENKRLDVKQLTLGIGEGTLRGTSFLSVKGLKPKGGIKFIGSDFDLAKLMSEKTQERLVMTSDMEIDLMFSGKSIFEWMEGLTGSFDVTSTEVTTVGVNVESLQSAFMSLFGLAGYNGSETKGSFNMSSEIESGVLRSDDGLFVFPNVVVNATGKVDLRRMVMNFRVKPNSDNILGFNIPILIKGDVTSPFILPEVTAIQSQGALIGTAIAGPVGTILGTVIGKILDADEAKEVSNTPKASEEIIDEKQKLRDEVLRFLQSE